MEMVGPFNVTLYPALDLDQTTGKEYHLLDLSEWNGNTRIKQRFLHVEPGPEVKSMLEDEALLKKLIAMKNNAKVALSRKVETAYTIKEV